MQQTGQAELAVEDGVKVAIVGVGLIGGSLALAWRGRPGVQQVIGIDRDEAALETALTIGAIDRAASTLEAVAACDVVVVAVPVRSIVGVVRQLVPHCTPGTIITDVGSTKGEICQQVAGILPSHLTFIGGHPMAGAERRGVEAGDRYLFQNAVYVLSPPADVDSAALQLMQDLVRAAGAHPVLLAPADHDRAVAVTSHLPHVAAAALVAALGKVAADLPAAFRLAAGGFKDTTRIASGDPIIWRDICLSNRNTLLPVIDTFSEVLSQFRQLVANEDGAGLEAAFGASKHVRDRLPAHAKGILGRVFDVVVHVIDRPGAISEVSSLLAQEQLNISDIEILRVREGEGGTLRIAFENEAAMKKGLATLREAGYQARVR